MKFFSSNLILLLLTFNFNLGLLAQGFLGVKGGSFLGADIGVQMTGIRSEDFVLKNIAPRINFYAGKKLNNIVSIQVGYEGFYFNTIANNDQRYFNYYNIKIEHKLPILNENNLYLDKSYLAFQIGGGLFQNLYYRRPNFTADIGLLYLFPFNNTTQLVARFNSLMGWDLYQGDEDIINSFSFGLRYKL